MRSSLIALVFAMAAAGCLDGVTEPDDGALTSATQSTLTWTGTTYTLPYRGGTGGSGPFWFSCYPGDVMVGMFGRGATDVDQVGLICAHLTSNGSLTNEYWLGGYGSNGGSPFYVHCDAGLVVSGFFGAAHTFLDRLGIACSVPPTSGQPVSWYQGTGGTGGDAFYDICPAGYAVDTISLRWGSWIDAFQSRCRYWAP